MKLAVVVALTLYLLAGAVEVARSQDRDEAYRRGLERWQEDLREHQRLERQELERQRQELNRQERERDRQERERWERERERQALERDRQERERERQALELRQRAREERWRYEQELDRQERERERQFREREREREFRRVWHRGDRLPRRYFSREFRVYDYGAFGLRRPPKGHCWIRADNRLLLTTIATGVVIDIISIEGRR